MKASLRSFIEATERHTIQATDQEILLNGNCPRCHSTLAVEIALARGHATHGEIETFRAQAAETGQPLTPVEEAELREAIEETPEELARRLIR